MVRDEFRLLTSVMNSFKGHLKPPSWPGHPPHHSSETSWGFPTEGQTKQCPEGVKVQRTLN